MQCMIENRGLFMENNIKEESRLKFQFAENDIVIKFDDTKFYRDYFNKLPEAKGVDFISVAKDKIATVYKGNIIKNLIMDCQSYTKYRPNETTGGIFVSWRRKEELPTGA
jgi:hypothetical protein